MIPHPLLYPCPSTHDCHRGCKYLALSQAVHTEPLELTFLDTGLLHVSFRRMLKTLLPHFVYSLVYSPRPAVRLAHLIYQWAYLTLAFHRELRSSKPIKYASASERQPETSTHTQRLQDHQQSQILPQNSIDERRNQYEYLFSRSEEKSYSHLRAFQYQSSTRNDSLLVSSGSVIDIPTHDSNEKARSSCCNPTQLLRG